MIRNSSQSHSQTGNLFTGVPGFIFRLRHPSDLPVPCLSLWQERERMFLHSYHPLDMARQKRERLHSGLDTWYHNSKNSSKFWDTCHFLLQVTVCVTHTPARSSKVATTSFGIWHKRSQNNKLKAFSGGPRNCIMTPWEDAWSSWQPCYRCSGYCQHLNFVCGQGRRVEGETA